MHNSYIHRLGFAAAASAFLLLVPVTAVEAQVTPPTTAPPTSPPVASPPGTPQQTTPPPVVTAPAQPTAPTQLPPEAAGLTTQQIQDAIRSSGLSEAQVRDRLRAAGYNPALADPFFAAQAGAAGATAGGTVPGASSGASPDFVRALTTLGILSGSDQPTTDRRNPDVSAGGAGSVFGKDVFNRASTAFDPVTAGPVDPGYRLGVNDQLQLIITGGVELAYALDIRRDGTVVIPTVGQVSVAGLTLEGARTLLRQRAAEVYNGLKTGTAKLDLTISRIRTNSIFVIGEVEEPGAYQVNALSTVFGALARAGGPAVRGSFRAVEVRRAGQVVKRVDLYRYLLDGDASEDIRLEQGDVIFVPLNNRAVAVSGAVRRPRIFELRPDEGFDDLMRFAGGVLPTASLDRVQIDRILPAAQRAPGIDRVKIDLRLNGRIENGGAFTLADGDVVTVFAIGDLRRNTISIGGAVFDPGEYEYRQGMTVDSLIARARGLLPFAIRERVLIHRLLPETGRTESFVVSLDSAGGRNFRLAEFDQVGVLDVRRDYPSREISVSGAVNNPAVMPYLEHESLRDVIDRAGGFTEGAQLVSVARRRTGAAFNDTTSIVTNFAAAVDFSPGGRASSMLLEPFDRIDVRMSPGYRGQKFVRLSGDFLNPGLYAITENVDRVSDVVKRAGGLLPYAYAASFQLRRNDLPVALDFTRAMDGDDKQNLLVKDGDELTIHSDPNVVRVVGAVSRPSLIRFQPGLGVFDYIELSGGPAELGEKKQAVVDYPSGFSRRVRRRLFFWTSQPEVISGSTITVPATTQKDRNFDTVITRTVQTISGLATLIVTYLAIRRN
jgi:protein involved in polysaccharide export with SLBB domain